MTIKPTLMLLAIRAMQDKAQQRSAEEWVHLCITAAEEAYASVMENPPREKDEGGTATKYWKQIAAERGIPEEVSHYEGEKLIEVATAAARVAYRGNMPQLTSRTKARAYIACVAVGVQRHYVTGPEARSLLYTAQLSLSAYPKREQKPRQPRRKAGFQA